jgi:hypothetical protein
MHGSKMWVENKNQKDKLQVVEMDYLLRSARKSKLERVHKEETRKIMQSDETVLGRIEIKKLK